MTHIGNHVPHFDCILLAKWETLIKAGGYDGNADDGLQLMISMDRNAIRIQLTLNVR